MVVVNLVQVLMVYHFLQVLIHFLLAHVLVRVCLLVPCNYLWVFEPYISQLITQSHPSRHAVVRSSKKFYFFASWSHPFDDSVNLIWFPACFPHFWDDDITIEPGIDLWISLNPHQAMLLGMVEPVSCFSCDDEPMDLIGFDPDDLIDLLVPPLVHAISGEFHGSTCDP